MNAGAQSRQFSDVPTSGGAMSGMVATKDWSLTPLGALDTWPQSLRTTVSLCLASNFPINIIWGPGHIQIYNDGYRSVCGEAHPAALGQDYGVTWASAWPAIGEPFERALAGETTFLENQRMFLTRNGYLEETFFTFSTSPIRDESGGIGGLFHPVTETTATMLAERRTRALRDLTAGLAQALDVEDLVAIALRTLAGYDLDLPVLLVYGLAEGTGDYRLATQFGIVAGSPASPESMDAGTDRPWPVADAVRSCRQVVSKIDAALLIDVRCGPYDEPPGQAILIPVAIPGAELPPLLFIAGASPRLPLNDDYLGFFQLLGAALGAAFAGVRAREIERRRAEALAEIDRAKTVFFSNVSHEFRTPLTLMLGPLADALADSAALPAIQRARLDMAHRNAQRLLRLVNTLLDFSRIEAGRTVAHFEPVDLATLTANLASNFRSACQRAGLDLVVRCSPLSAPIHVDRDMWEKIVLNLLSNAFKFTLEGRIAIGLVEEPTEVVLTVCDTGVGIPVSELPRVFERFHRIEGQRARTHEGTGIGLSLVQELVGLHGGSISAESVEGQGTKFSVRLVKGVKQVATELLPASWEAASTAVRAEAFVAEAVRWLPDAKVGQDDGVESAAQADRPRVILADDNADMRAYVHGILTQGGYDVVAVADGAEALTATRAQPAPHLVLSDVMMPGMDGFELLREIRGDPALERLLVILLSARAGEEARLEGLAAGADDYLVKPFSARELRARVDGATKLARQRAEASERERLMLTDIATAESRAALRETEERLELAIKAGRLGSWTLNLESGELTTSEICRSNFGRTRDEPLEYDELLASIHADDRSIQKDAVAKAIDERGDLDVEYRVERPDGELAWVLIRGRAEYAADGRPLRMAGVSLDITDRKRAEERTRLLLDELNHRVKNTIATVQSIATQTLRSAYGPAAFTESLTARIGALSRAHDLLNLSSWDGAQLKDVVAQTLAPYSADGSEHHLHVSGPPVRLSPNAAVTLNMAFHELATNAAKYGSLSTPGGQVAVSWSLDRTTEPTYLELEWVERGGPVVKAATRRGFGSRLLEQGIAREMDGKVELAFLPAGLNCRMRLRTSTKIAGVT